MDDDAGFRQFVTARWPALVQSAYLITVDRGIAEDCVQEALTRVHRRWHRLGDGNPEPYVRKAVVNAALSWRRKRRIARCLWRRRRFRWRPSRCGRACSKWTRNWSSPSDPYPRKCAPPWCCGIWKIVPRLRPRT